MVDTWTHKITESQNYVYYDYYEVRTRTSNLHGITNKCPGSLCLWVSQCAGETSGCDSVEPRYGLSYLLFSQTDRRDLNKSSSRHGPLSHELSNLRCKFYLSKADDLENKKKGGIGCTETKLSIWTQRDEWDSGRNLISGRNYIFKACKNHG